MSERRALLLTDIVDSTATAEALGDAAAAALWSAHDRSARDLLPVWRGREIDKTDGMLLLFDHAADALGYARAYNQAIRSLPVPISSRAGLHFADVTLRENSAADVLLGAKPLEVDGVAKPLAARVMALARGGQILLTAEARESLGEEVAAQVSSHGHWAIKGIAEPVELFEAGEAGMTLSAPTDGDKAYRVTRVGDRWVPVKEIPNNLPQLMTSFQGRERELVDVKGLLARARLVTLLGMGGLGKTRLSIQVAADLTHEYPDGVWFIDLAPIRDSGLVVSEAAQVLDVMEERGRPLIQTLCNHLKTRRVLLILDNCEHLTKAAAELANAVLRTAPRVCVLASSRETLRVPGEQTYPVHPLPVPARDANVEALLRSPAVRLFIDRAKQHRPSFSLTSRDAPAVAEMVVRLEGIPLALELAAARMKSMTVSDINTRLKDRFKLLTGGGSVLLERQQTLRALVDWSYVLLSPDEQKVLTRLSVFMGGFDLAAAEDVCGAEPVVARRRGRPAPVAGREIARHARSARREHPLPGARDDPRLRTREARARRRSSQPRRCFTATTISHWPRRRGKACGVKSRPTGSGVSKPNSTTCVRRRRWRCRAASTRSSRSRSRWRCRAFGFFAVTRPRAARS